MKTITKLMKKSNQHKAINELLTGFNVFAPVGKEERLAFTAINSNNIDAIELTGAPVMPPKELLLPRSETLYDIDLKSGEIATPDMDHKKTILFGVRPCDARSFINLDAVFLEKSYVDSAYAEKRKNLTIISLACAEIPYESCFCDQIGGGPADQAGSDVFLAETSDHTAWIVSFLTERGAEIAEIWDAAGCFEDETAFKASKPVKTPVCGIKIDVNEELPAKLTAAFEDANWAYFSEACLGCGTCAYVCPTCYCFDIDTETSEERASEFRCWDCCMFSDYSRMAGGHNPRPTKKERLRNRYLHKLAYFNERYDKTLCVGCGRCISKCPAGLDITSVIEWGGTL